VVYRQGQRRHQRNTLEFGSAAGVGRFGPRYEIHRFRHGYGRCRRANGHLGRLPIRLRITLTDFRTLTIPVRWTGHGQASSWTPATLINSGSSGVTVTLLAQLPVQPDDRHDRSRRDRGLGALGASTVVNAGTIDGSGYAGIRAEFVAGSSADQCPKISGSSGTAVSFAGGGKRLIVDPGAVFSGIVNGGRPAATVGVAAGVSTNARQLRDELYRFRQCHGRLPSTWLLNGTNTLGAGTILTDFGTLEDATRWRTAGHRHRSGRS